MGAHLRGRRSHPAGRKRHGVAQVLPQLPIPRDVMSTTTPIVPLSPRSTRSTNGVSPIISRHVTTSAAITSTKENPRYDLGSSAPRRSVWRFTLANRVTYSRLPLALTGIGLRSSDANGIGHIAPTAPRSAL